MNQGMNKVNVNEWRIDIVDVNEWRSKYSWCELMKEWIELMCMNVGMNIVNVNEWRNKYS